MGIAIKNYLKKGVLMVVFLDTAFQNKNTITYADF